MNAASSANAPGIPKNNDIDIVIFLLFLVYYAGLDEIIYELYLNIFNAPPQVSEYAK
jgi:hypothetical protein